MHFAWKQKLVLGGGTQHHSEFDMLLLYYGNSFVLVFLPNLISSVSG